MNAKTKELMRSYHFKTSYKHAGHARRAALKHSSSPYAKKNGIEFVVIDYDAYMNLYGNLTKKVTSLSSGKEIEISINTPACCDPSTETYWSM
jgi:hypothetical protein